MSKVMIAVVVLFGCVVTASAEAQNRSGGRSRSSRSSTPTVQVGSAAERPVNTKIAIPRLGRRVNQRVARYLTGQRAHATYAVGIKKTAPFDILIATPGVSYSHTAAEGVSSQPAETYELSQAPADGIIEAIGTFPVSGHVLDPQWGGRSRAEVDQWSTSDTISMTLQQGGESSAVPVLTREPSTGHGTQIAFRVQLKPGTNVLRYFRNAPNGGTSEGSEPYLRTIVINWNPTPQAAPAPAAETAPTQQTP